MCLTITSDKVLVAKKNVVCYKVLTKHQRSPFHYFRYERGLIHLSDMRLDLEKYDPVEKGFHTFSSYFRIWIARFNIEFGSDSGRMKIYKFIIPKGTYYYKGTWWKYKGYCSESIKMK